MSPFYMQNLARDFLSDPVFLAVGRIGSTSEDITQVLQWVKEGEKVSALLALLGNKG